MRRKNIILTIIIIIFIASAPAYGNSNLPIKVSLDGRILDFDVSPIIHNDSTYLPLRVIFKELGSKDIMWDQEEKKATASLDGTTLELTLDSNIAVVNGMKVGLDAPVMMIKDRVLVPARFVSESFGSNVDWDNRTKTVYIDSKGKINKITNEILNVSLKMGDEKNQLIKLMGKPNRIDKSEKGHEVYIFNNNIKDYIQIGIKDNKIIEIVTNSSNWHLNEDFIIGTSRSALSKAYKMDKYKYDNSDEVKLGNNKLTLMWDSHDENKLSLMHIRREMDEGKAKYDKEVEKGLSMQIHDLTNVYRDRHNLSQLEWGNNMAKIANYHTMDMVNNNFFSHKSSNGDTPYERALRLLGNERSIGENIARGFENNLFSIEGLYNSIGHRQNMLLPDFTHSGVSVVFKNGLHITHNLEIR